MTQSNWLEYHPTRKQPWNLQRVVHLHRRAGFAATWTELKRDLREGPKSSVERFLSGTAYLDRTPEDFERTARRLAEAAMTSRHAGRLKAWWIYRMLYSPDPLTERLVLMWHNHFATSNRKVDNVALMHHQNQLFRDSAQAPFGELLQKVVRDPAMLVWLDAQSNRREHPNENLARELMELFTLGIGHYTETDVKEVARALTGWTVSFDGTFQSMADQHDSGDKTILGHKGTWDGDDVVRILLEHPATSQRIAFRICDLLMGEATVSSDALDELAAGLRERELDVRWAVATVLRSEAFFADGNLRSRILSPTEFVVGSVLALELSDPPPSTLVLAEWMAQLGQDLFYPPSVFGWPGGRGWITTRAMIGRAAFASALLEGGQLGRPSPANLRELARRHQRNRDRADIVAFFGELLFGSPATDVEKLLATRHASAAGDLRRIVASMLASPEAQLA